MTATALDRLAARFGIEPQFRSMSGEDVLASPETKRRLLAAMGVDVEAHIGRDDASLAVLDPVDGFSLPPVLVLRPVEGNCVIELPLPCEARTLVWRLKLEDGTDLNGVAELSRGPRRFCDGDRSLRRFVLPDVPWGYHHLHLPELPAVTLLIVTPGTCWLPEHFGGGAGLWGIAAQLYLLRSERNWGIGDFADLAQLAAIAGRRGCDVIGVNPLHQMFLDHPEQASPYSPLSRLFLNILYIAVPEAPGYQHSPEAQRLVSSSEFQARLGACRSAVHVDYAGVLALKLEVLQLLHGSFKKAPADAQLSFAQFVDEGGELLRRTSVFQALRQQFGTGDPEAASWRAWSDEYRDAGSDAVERFAADHAEEVEFLSWLQWIAHAQLTAAAQAARDAGMVVGLYRDLAVGCERSGAETWVKPAAFLTDTQVGAPPDVFNPAGQCWGLPPFHPTALRAEAYRSFIELIRANMRDAGGLRIDHVMGLQHLFCIPDGLNPDEGAFVSYPLDDLVGILALESHRHRCLVVGEDLGTVPEGFRDEMAAANILSYRVLVFERDTQKGGFLQPCDYPRLGLAVAGSHDLPPLAAWWEGTDLELAGRLELQSSDEVLLLQKRRDHDRTAILEALRREELLPEGEFGTDGFITAAHEFLAMSGAGLVLLQLEDLLAEVERVNFPGTSLEHPNWRRRYRTTLEELACEDVWRPAGRVPKLRGTSAMPKTGQC